MSDLGDSYRDMAEYKKECRTANLAKNLRILRESDLIFEERNEGVAILFRGESFRANYYPSTGYGFDCDTDKKFCGDAHKFIKICNEKARDGE